MSKRSRLSYTGPGPSVLASDFRLIAHVVLEDMIRYGVPAEPTGLIRLASYLNVAWLMAAALLKTPPKTLAEAKIRLDAWRHSGTLKLDDASLHALCDAVTCADSLWERIPPIELLKVIDALKEELGSVA